MKERVKKEKTGHFIKIINYILYCKYGLDEKNPYPCNIRLNENETVTEICHCDKIGTSLIINGDRKDWYTRFLDKLDYDTAKTIADIMLEEQINIIQEKYSARLRMLLKKGLWEYLTIVSKPEAFNFVGEKEVKKMVELNAERLCSAFSEPMRENCKDLFDESKAEKKIPFSELANKIETALVGTTYRDYSETKRQLTDIIGEKMIYCRTCFSDKVEEAESKDKYIMRVEFTTNNEDENISVDVYYGDETKRIVSVNVTCEGEIKPIDDPDKMYKVYPVHRIKGYSCGYTATYEEAEGEQARMAAWTGIEWKIKQVKRNDKLLYNQ